MTDSDTTSDPVTVGTAPAAPAAPTPADPSYTVSPWAQRPSAEPVHDTSDSPVHGLQNAVSPDAFAALENWFNMPTRASEIKHGYHIDLGDFASDPEDAALVNGLLNSLSHAGASESDAVSFLNWLADAEESYYNTLDQKHIGEVEIELKQRWGDMYHQNLQVVHRHVSSLPVEQREHLLNHRAQDGRALLNDPVVLVDLLAEAQSGSNNLANEIAEIENFMRSNRREYLKNAAMQSRLRELYRQRDGSS